MKIFRPLLAALVLCGILQGTTARLRADNAEPPLYLVLFRLVAGADGKVQDIQMVKVIDLLSGSNNAAAVELPRAFLDQARQKAAAEPLQKPTSNLMSFLFVPEDGKPGPTGPSFGLLSGIAGSVAEFRLLSQGAALSAFGTRLGASAFFVSYYALGSLPKTTAEQRAAIVEAEVQRCAANLPNAEVLGRKDLSTPSQTILEVTCKTPSNRALTLRARYVCNDRQVLAFTAITPDDLPAKDRCAVDQLFDAFRFR